MRELGGFSMFQFFDGITLLINTVIQFVVNSVQMIMIIIAKVPIAIGFIVTSVSYLPPFLASFAMLFMAVTVIINMINKGD